MTATDEETQVTAAHPLAHQPVVPNLTRRLGELKDQADRDVANLVTRLRELDKTRDQLRAHGIEMTVTLGPVGDAAAVARRQVDQHEGRPVFRMPAAS